MSSTFSPSLLVYIRTVRDLLILSIILVILLDLCHDPLIRIRPDHHPQRRILHDRKLIHGLGRLGWIPYLRPIALLHICFSIDMVVRGMALSKLHAATRPIGPEATWLYTRELDVPLRFQLIAHGLCEALDGPLGGAVDAKRRHANLATDAGHLLDQPATRLLLAHRLHCLARHVDQAEVVDFHLPPDLLIGEFFKAPGQTVAGVVHHDVDAGELLECGVEGGLDGGF